MKELNDLMEALKKRDIPKKLQWATNVVGYPAHAKDDEDAQRIINGATKHALKDIWENDDELASLFVDYSYELGMNSLIKELNIKVADKGEKSKVPDILKKLIDEIFE